jgi:hypothetical protein
LNIPVTTGFSEKPLAFKRFFEKPISCVEERVLYINKEIHATRKKITGTAKENLERKIKT